MDEFNSPEDIVRHRRPDVPVNCFRPTVLTVAAQWFTANFPGKVLYAVKANPAPHVVSGLWNAGITHFDVASVPEIQLVRELCPGAALSYMHPVKSRLSIEQAYFDHGVRDFSFDALEELEKIVAVTGKSKDLTLIMRTAVPNTACEFPLSGKFGVTQDKAIPLLKAARKHAARLGVSFHVGSQTMDPQAYLTALALVGKMIQSAPRLRVDIIDIGGGFPSAYPDLIPPSLADYKSAIERGFDQLPHPGRYEFWCEPGRALVAESSSVLVRVDLRKDDVLYINDGTYGSLFDAGHCGLRFPVRLVRPNEGKSTAALKAYRFYGPTCDSIDYMPGPFMLPEDIREGDYIEIGQVGAYGNTLRTNFNGFYATENAIVKTPPLLTMYDESPEVAAHQVKMLVNS